MESSTDKSSTADRDRRDQECADKIVSMQAKIDEGRASGINPYSVSEIFDMARTDVNKRKFV